VEDDDRHPRLVALVVLHTPLLDGLVLVLLPRLLSNDQSLADQCALSRAISFIPSSPYPHSTDGLHPGPRAATFPSPWNRRRDPVEEERRSLNPRVRVVHLLTP
jgi:hypothetical protein